MRHPNATAVLAVIGRRGRGGILPKLCSIFFQEGVIFGLAQLPCQDCPGRVSCGQLATELDD